MVIAMPISHLWTTFIIPLVSWWSEFLRS